MPELPRVHPPTELRERHDRVRLTVLVYRKEGTSVEDFQKYWRNEHSQLFANMKIVKKNLLKYELGQNDVDAVEKLKGVGFPTTTCDGMAVFEAVTWDKLFEVFTDEEYVNNAIPDEEKFLDRSKSQAFPSTLVGVFDDPT